MDFVLVPSCSEAGLETAVLVAASLCLHQEEVRRSRAVRDHPADGIPLRF